MPFGQSYGIYRIVSNVVEDACKTTGTPDAASKAAGNMVVCLCFVNLALAALCLSSPAVAQSPYQEWHGMLSPWSDSSGWDRLSPRQKELDRSLQKIYEMKRGAIPINRMTVVQIMQIIDAQPNEAEYVVSRMKIHNQAWTVGNMVDRQLECSNEALMRNDIYGMMHCLQ